MSNVVRLCGFARRDRAVPMAAATAIDGMPSLLESWQSMVASIKQLENYIDALKPAVDTLPGGPEKSDATLLLKSIEAQIQDIFALSIAASLTAARIEARDDGDIG
jgi:hypothetical protein